MVTHGRGHTYMTRFLIMPPPIMSLELVYRHFKFCVLIGVLVHA